MISKEQEKAYTIMGADVKQTAEQFGNSAKFCAGRTRPPTRRSSLGRMPSSPRKQRSALA